MTILLIEQLLIQKPILMRKLHKMPFLVHKCITARKGSNGKKMWTELKFRG